jgi:hypothetical protein
MNMSVDGRAMQMEFNGQAFVPVFAPNEFGLQARQAIGAMRKAFITGLEVIRREVHKFPAEIPSAALCSAVAMLTSTAPAFAATLIPVLKDIERAEHAISVAARSEQNRSKGDVRPASEPQTL